MDEAELNKAIHRCFDSHTASSLLHIAPFAEMLKDDPKRAIETIFEVYNRALNEAYTDDSGVNNRDFVEAVAGGPCETIPWDLYNAVGAVYPYLEREQKDRALGKVLNILDSRNYAEVNGGRGEGHTPGIREPLLLSDICIARPLYWPGLYDEEHKWKKYIDFSELRAEMIDENGMFRTDRVNSDFLVAYALLRRGMCDFGEEYVNAANPAFLERTLRGIVALRFSGKPMSDEKIEKGRNRLEGLLPKSVHHRIEPLRKEADWVDYMKFH